MRRPRRRPRESSASRGTAARPTRQTAAPSGSPARQARRRRAHARPAPACRSRTRRWRPRCTRQPRPFPSQPLRPPPRIRHDAHRPSPTQQRACQNGRPRPAAANRPVRYRVVATPARRVSRAARGPAALAYETRTRLLRRCGRCRSAACGRRTPRPRAPPVAPSSVIGCSVSASTQIDVVDAIDIQRGARPGDDVRGVAQTAARRRRARRTARATVTARGPARPATGRRCATTSPARRPRGRSARRRSRSPCPGRDHAADDRELLVVLLAEHRDVGPDDVEQLGDDRRDAGEVAGPERRRTARAPARAPRPSSGSRADTRRAPSGT